MCLQNVTTYIAEKNIRIYKVCVYTKGNYYPLFNTVDGKAATYLRATEAPFVKGQTHEASGASYFLLPGFLGGGFHGFSSYTLAEKYRRILFKVRLTRLVIPIKIFYIPQGTTFYKGVIRETVYGAGLPCVSSTRIHFGVLKS